MDKGKTNVAESLMNVQHKKKGTKRETTNALQMPLTKKGKHFEE